MLCLDAVKRPTIHAILKNEWFNFVVENVSLLDDKIDLSCFFDQV